MWSALATHEPVAYSGLHVRQPFRAAIVHTNGSKGTDLRGWWDSCAAGQQGPSLLHVGAQYQVLLDGTAIQYVDSSVVVYHAYGASEWAVGIEHQDNGDPNLPFSTAQLDTTARLLHELGIPPVLLSSANPANGIGYHSQFPEWNQSGHYCPGSVRVAQVSHDLLPRLRTLYTAPVPVPTEVPEMYLCADPRHGWWYVLGQPGLRRIGPTELALYQQAGVPVAHVDPALLPSS